MSHAPSFAVDCPPGRWRATGRPGIKGVTRIPNHTIDGAPGRVAACVSAPAAISTDTEPAALSPVPDSTPL
jgi:hypothetical protein